MKIKWSHFHSVSLICLFAASRWPGLLPHNFSLVYGFVLCSVAFSAVLPWWGVLGTLVGTDVAVNVFYYETAPFSDYMLANYAAYGLIFWMGRFLTRGTSILRFIGGGLLAATAFYLVTNTAAWFHNLEYPRTLSGWFQSLTVGTRGWPETWKFFRNTLLSGGLFSGFLAAGLRAWTPAPAEQEKPVEEESDQPSEAPAGESKA